MASVANPHEGAGQALLTLAVAEKEATWLVMGAYGQQPYPPVPARPRDPAPRSAGATIPVLLAH